MKVFIVGGAGIVGSASAAYLAMRRIADEIVIQDLNENMAQSHAMDLSQAAFLDSPAKIRFVGWPEAEHADVVVIAAGLPALQATHDSCKDILAMRPLIRSIVAGVKQYCPETVVLSMTNPLDAFNYMLYRESGLPARQFIAMSVNDSLRFRWALAEHLGISADRVDAFVIGEHNPQKIRLFSTVTVDGKRVAFSEAEQQEILQDADRWWKRFLDVSGARTAAWTTGSSCGLTVAHLAGQQTGPICCSYIAEDGLSIGWPVYLDRTGVTAPADLDLTPAEAERFERAKAQARASITEVMAYWDQHP